LRSVRKQLRCGLMLDPQQRSFAVIDALAHAHVDEEDQTIEIREHRALLADRAVVEGVRPGLMSEDDVRCAESVGVAEEPGFALDWLVAFFLPPGRRLHA